jgi:hypothetical protein
MVLKQNNFNFQALSLIFKVELLDMLGYEEHEGPYYGF